MSNRSIKFFTLVFILCQQCPDFSATPLRDHVLKGLHLLLNQALVHGLPGDKDSLDPKVKLTEFDRRYFHVIALVEKSPESEIYFLREEIFNPSIPGSEMVDPIQYHIQSERFQWIREQLRQILSASEFHGSDLLGISLALLLLDEKRSILKSKELVMLRDHLRIPSKMLNSIISYQRFMKASPTKSGAKHF
ncbi:hypothetical protein HOF92_12100 [bacterium]|jgi:hypothetical protein|nr:hypothetical protein [bacterium]